MDCPVQIHHGPGHQSTTECHIEEPHEIHEAIFGEWQQHARWRGGDIFSSYFDEAPNEDTLDTSKYSYVSDTSWYQNDYAYYVTKYMPKDYRDPRLPIPMGE